MSLYLLAGLFVTSVIGLRVGDSDSDAVDKIPKLTRSKQISRRHRFQQLPDDWEEGDPIPIQPLDPSLGEEWWKSYWTEPYETLPSKTKGGEEEEARCVCRDADEGLLSTCFSWEGRQTANSDGIALCCSWKEVHKLKQHGGSSNISLTAKGTFKDFHYWPSSCWKDEDEAPCPRKSNGEPVKPAEGLERLGALWKNLVIPSMENFLGKIKHDWETAWRNPKQTAWKIAKVVGGVTFAACVLAIPGAAVPIGIAAMAWSNFAALVDAGMELRAGFKKKHVLGKLFLRIVSSTASAVGLIDINLPLDAGHMSDASAAGASITDFFAEKGIWTSLAGVCYSTHALDGHNGRTEDVTVVELDQDLSPDLKTALTETLEADYPKIQKTVENSFVPDEKKKVWLEDLKKWRDSNYGELNTIGCDFILAMSDGLARRQRLQRSHEIKGMVTDKDCRRAPIFGRENGNPFCVTAPPCPNGR